MRARGIVVWVTLALVCGRTLPARGASFVEFESGEVRPLAMSPDGSRLFAVNTPDNRLEIFTINPGRPALTYVASVSVGMEPIAVAARNNNEVWVVNHLSDSVSIVDVSTSPPQVTQTLLVGDEPRDIVFAGTGGVDRAFITCAHRGQNSGVPLSDLTTSGIGRADVWVFDTTNLGTSLGGTPVGGTPVVLFGDTPRALAVSPDRSTVYAAVFHSGNRTTAISEGAVPDGGFNSGGLPFPNTDSSGDKQPETGLVVKYDGTHWKDRACVAGSNAGWACQQDSDCPGSTCGRTWDSAVEFSLPDKDVFAINANTATQTTFWSGVGTILFNMTTNPVTGKVYVTNGDSNNVTRFEGPGIFGRSTVQGHLLEMRITVLDGTNVLARHLNKHIIYSQLPAPAGVKDNSLATPLGMAISSDGATMYVAAFGSSKVGVFATSDIENDTFVPSSANQIAVSGGGPSGILLDEVNQRLYVHTRFDNGISVIDTNSRTEIDHPSLYNPEPATVVNGRPFLYDASFTSSNGEASCSSCHIFGDFDSLAWDLGNPDSTLTTDPLVVKLGAFIGSTVNDPTHFNPMKGPMTTQTLRGLVNHGAMHWRGDRVEPEGDGQCQTAGFPFACCTGAGTGTCTIYDPEVAFQNFRVAFPGLVGRDSQIPDADMKAFSDFILQVYQPPNPNRSLDNSRTTSQADGFNFFTGNAFQSSVTGTTNSGRCADGVSSSFCLTSSTGDSQAAFACHGCHTLDPANGFFGGDGKQSFENEPQLIKIAHLRNLYQKVGMFGMPTVPFDADHGSVCLGGTNNGVSCTSNANCPGTGAVCGENIFMGDQVRGFGFLHDGSVSTIYQFLHASVFDRHNGLGFPSNDSRNGDSYRRDVEQMLLAFDSDFAPVVGQQVSLTSTNAAVAGPRIDLLIARANTAFTLKGSPEAHECDLVVKGTVGDLARGWVRLSDGTFQPDRNSESPISDSVLRALAGVPGQNLTYTCVPPGSGVRIGIDRDLDGYYDRTELDAGSDPANPASIPGAGTTTPTLSPNPTPTIGLGSCVGDCDSNGTVTVDELITLVNIALGLAQPSACPHGIPSGRAVDITLIVQAVGYALTQCPSP